MHKNLSLAFTLLLLLATAGLKADPQPETKAQNNALQQKFGISGFPTLMVIDGNERVLGQMSGYNPGSGPGPVIARLQAMR